ncbi:MAG: tetratricopeptide repeat protein [Chitinophagales bacterium]
MMKRYLISLVILFFYFSAWSQNDSTSSAIDTSTYVYASVMYEKGDYKNAIEIYDQLLEKNGESAEIYYDLGNCYYKIDHLGNAVLNYERALLLDPSDDDIKYNLQLTNLRIRDKIDPVSEPVLLVWWRNFIKLLSVHIWAFLTILFLWIALAGFILYRYANKINQQRAGFYIFAFSIIIFLITAIAAYSKNDYDSNYRFAVVMAPSSIVKSEPNESSTNLFLIHEGLKIRLIDYEEGWNEIKMPDGNVGWVKEAEIESVRRREQ